MNNLEKAAKMLVGEYGSTSLLDFRKEALRELNGTAYASVRIDGGPRLMLMLCVTSPDQLSIIDDKLNIVEDPEPIEWDSTTMDQIFFHTARGMGFSYEERRNNNGERTSLLLCATNPDSIKLFENIFQLPN